VLQRPYTSKASLASMTSSATPAASSGSTPNGKDQRKGLISPRISPRDAVLPGIPGRQASDIGRGGGDDDATTATTTATAAAESSVGGDSWRCLKCAARNTNPVFCDACATRRGSSGARGAQAAIPRF
jgi:hypothetical protein